MRSTFHLVPAETWAAADAADGGSYEAPSLAIEGFIHCTDGAEELIATANRYYRDDPRPYLALTIDLGAAGSPWWIEDPVGIYPHIFGPIARRAITDIRSVVRAADGTFLGLAAQPAVQFE